MAIQALNQLKLKKELFLCETKKKVRWADGQIEGKLSKTKYIISRQPCSSCGLHVVVGGEVPGWASKYIMRLSVQQDNRAQLFVLEEEEEAFFF